ncbi:MAG: hypothetical protein GY940_14210, partial [bacterium]|nr:hypothetical protein [bacterium]
ADYILRFGHIPLAVLEAKAESKDPITGLQQVEQYASRLGLRFAISGNGFRYYLIDCLTQEREEFTSVPTPRYILQKSSKKSKRKKTEGPPIEKPVAEGVTVFISSSQQFVCFADGGKIPLDQYRRQSREIIRGIAPVSIDELLKIWIDKNTRKELRAELKDQDVYIAAFRHYFQLDAADDVDILTKVGFDLPRVPSRHDRVTRFREHEENWLRDLLHKQPMVFENRYLLAAEEPGRYGNIQAIPIKLRFWETCLDHYSLFGIDDLEQG